MEVYVVTNVDLGWDCVCGVFLTLDSLKEFFMAYFDVEDDSTEDSYFKKMTFNELYAEVGERARSYCIFTEYAV